MRTTFGAETDARVGLCKKNGRCALFGAVRPVLQNDEGVSEFLTQGGAYTITLRHSTVRVPRATRHLETSGVRTDRPAAKVGFFVLLQGTKLVARPMTQPFHLERPGGLAIASYCWLLLAIASSVRVRRVPSGHRPTVAIVMNIRWLERVTHPATVSHTPDPARHGELRLPGLNGESP